MHHCIWLWQLCLVHARTCNTCGAMRKACTKRQRLPSYLIENNMLWKALQACTQECIRDIFGKASGTGWENQKTYRKDWETGTFIVAHVHSPLFVSAVVVNGCDDTLGVSFCGVLLNSFQHALQSFRRTILRRQDKNTTNKIPLIIYSGFQKFTVINSSLQNMAVVIKCDVPTDKTGTLIYLGTCYYFTVLMFHKTIICCHGRCKIW